MNQEVYKPSHLFWSKLISAIIKPFFLLFNRHKIISTPFSVEDINTILVTEYHRIGDMIMSTSALRVIKNAFPNSKLILVTNPDAIQLAENMALADVIIGFSSPWTTWDWSLPRWKDAIAFGVKLRQFEIDLAIDFKGDMRNNWFLWLTTSKNRVGYDATGGSFFLTHSFQFPFTLHQSQRSLQLLSHLKMSLLKSKRSKNNDHVSKIGKIVLHPGASDPNRGWPNKHWVELIKQLYDNYSLAIVKVPELEKMCNEIIQQVPDIEVFTGSLAEFYNWLKNQRMLIGPDSMAGHLAAYVGVPTVTIFGSQNPSLTKPIGENAIVICPTVPCNHNRNHWRLCKECMKNVTTLMVYETIKSIELTT